jgi:hypothetical protein
MPVAKLRCITCHKDYDDAQAKGIHSRLAAFEEWCLCQECVDSCQKRGNPPKPKSSD